MVIQWFRSVFNLHFSSKKKLARQMKNTLGFTPGNIYLYQLAFTHSSTVSEVGENNERLELLGDSVLNLIIADYLYRKYPYRKEGFMSEMRAKIVSRKQLNKIARKMELQEMISTNLDKAALRKSSTLGNAFEALIGAIYLDKGYKKTLEFTKQKLLQVHIDLDHLEHKVENFKSLILQYGQKYDHEVVFSLLEEKNTDSGKIFLCAVYVNNVKMGEGEAFNKKHAEQQAAQEASVKLNLLNFHNL